MNHNHDAKFIDNDNARLSELIQTSLGPNCRLQTPDTEATDLASIASLRSLRKSDVFSDESSIGDSDSLIDYVTTPQRLLSGGTISLEQKFSLLEMLDSIQFRHRQITMSFCETQAKLQELKVQNKHDLAFLTKLTVHNGLMFERVHEMKSDVSQLHLEFKTYRKLIASEDDEARHLFVPALDFQIPSLPSPPKPSTPSDSHDQKSTLSVNKATGSTARKIRAAHAFVVFLVILVGIMVHKWGL